MGEPQFEIREMTIDDFPEVHKLWMTIKGFGIRTIDDSKEGVERFIKRNPTTSIVAEADGKIVGSILCGHDGRRGCSLSCLRGGSIPEARDRKDDGSGSDACAQGRKDQ